MKRFRRKEMEGLEWMKFLNRLAKLRKKRKALARHAPA